MAIFHLSVLLLPKTIPHRTKIIELELLFILKMVTYLKQLDLFILARLMVMMIYK